jgi:hypothetical protein
MSPKAILILLIVTLFPQASQLEADEPAQITRGAEPRGPKDFCVQVTGELRSFTGYLHSTAPFTLRQAIEAAGGIGEWGGWILIYSPWPNANAPEKLDTRIKASIYRHDMEVQDLPLKNGWHVHVAKLGPRF